MQPENRRTIDGVHQCLKEDNPKCPNPVSSSGLASAQSVRALSEPATSKRKSEQSMFS